MKALWESSPLNGSDIVRAVSARTDWSQSTILTMVRRLVQKKAVGISQQNVMIYYPLVEERDARRQATDMFLKRVYKGSVNMLVKGFIENGEISKEELEELKKIAIPKRVLERVF